MSDRAQEALEHLCNTYWRPLYAFARYSGYTAEDAQDITQAFLARIIETRGLGGSDQERGRFRSYLLGAMKHFMSNQRDRARAQKRGGGRRFVDRDIAQLESKIALHANASTPADLDQAFDREWAREITDGALKQLGSEWTERGRTELFEALRPTLAGEGQSRTELAAALDISENSVSVSIHRLRQRYAALIREAVGQTVANEEDIEDEMRYLVSVLRKK